MEPNNSSLSQTHKRVNRCSNSTQMGIQKDEFKPLPNAALRTIRCESSGQISVRSEKQSKDSNSRERSRGNKADKSGLDGQEVIQKRICEDPRAHNSLPYKHQELSTHFKRRYDKNKERSVLQPTKRSRRILARSQKLHSQDIQEMLLEPMIQEQHALFKTGNNEKSIISLYSDKSDRIPIFDTKTDLNTENIVKLFSRCNERFYLSKNQIDSDLTQLELKGMCVQVNKRAIKNGVKQEKFS